MGPLTADVFWQLFERTGSVVAFLLYRLLLGADG